VSIILRKLFDQELVYEKVQREYVGFSSAGRNRPIRQKQLKIGMCVGAQSNVPTGEKHVLQKTVGKKKRLSEHASELALPRGGGNPQFQAFAGLDDGTLGSTVTVNRQRSPRCRVAPTLRRPLSQKSGVFASSG
jgi:hypothetical protein